MDRFLANTERRAYRLAWFATGHREDALDIVQDSMIALVRHYAGRDPETWSALFHRILQNRIRDWHRRDQVRQRVRHWFGRDRGGEAPEDISQEDSFDALPGPDTEEPDNVRVRSEVVSAVDQAVRTLSPQQRQVFLLRAWEGLDTAETANAMGLSEGSVKTHYARAVRALRQQLQDLVFDDA